MQDIHQVQQLVFRKTLTGDFEEFNFGIWVREVLVKNFSDDPIYIAFQDDGSIDNATKLNSQYCEMIYYNASYLAEFDRLYIKGTGEVEVELVAW